MNSDFSHPQQSKQLLRQGGKKRQADIRLGEHHTSTAPSPPSQSSAASFTYFIIYSHVVPSKSQVLALLFTRKLRGGLGFRGEGPPADTQQERLGQGWESWGRGVQPRALLVELWPQTALTVTRPHGPLPQPPDLTITLTRPFPTRATRNTAPPVSAFEASGSSHHSRAQYPRPPCLPDPDPR